MKRKQRRFSDRVQLVVDEMLHLLGHSSTSSATAARGRSLQLTKLEERVLMSASPMAMVAEVATVTVESLPDAATFDVAAWSGAIDVVAADSSAVVNVDADAGFNTDTGSITETGLVADDAADDRSSDTAISSTPTVSDIELIVLDSRVQDADTLLSELLNSDRDFRILRLDSETDGVAQITEKLEQVGHVSAIHLLTHGTDGEILLGSTVLNASTLAQYAPEFLAWQHNLTDNADLLLYGCDVAQTTVGEDFVDALAGLAETDVAASTNATGSDALGGDWDLEFAVGSVQATTAFRTSVAQNWNDLLNVTLTDKSEFAVNTTTSNTQITSGETRGSQHAVSLAADGSYVVVWSSLNQDGSGYGVYARRFDAAGNPLTSEILINQTTSNNQQWARVASADDGTFVVTWTHGTAGSEDVFFRKFSANGTAQTTETRANNTTANSQKNSVIAMDRTTGQFVIAWQGEGPGDTSSIFFRRFASNGTATEVTDQLVNPAGTHSEQDPAIAMQTAGGFVIAFERGDSNKVYFQRFNSSGTKVGSETQIDNLLATSFGIDIASNAAGDFTVVYREQSLLPGIWQRGFNADGTQKYTWSQISSGDGVSPSIAMMGDGSYIVTWQKTGDSDATGIYAQRYNSDGSANGAEFLVNSTTAGAQSQPSVAALDAANFVVVWSGQGSTDTDGVYARQVHFSPPMLDLDANNSSGATAGNFAATFTSGGGSVAIADADATLVDVDSANLQSLVVTITNRQNGSSESLTAVTAGTNITASYFDGVLTLSGADTVANYQQVLRTVRYANSSTPTTGASRTITFVANDGVVKSEVATTSLTITGAAAAPPASNGGIVTGNEDTPSVFAWSDFNITDVDTAITSTTAIRLTTLPASGKLKYFNGTEWTEVGLGQVLTKADIDSGALRFQPDADESGYDGYATAGVGNMMQDYAQFNFTPLQTTIETIVNPGAEVDGLSENSVLTNATGWNSSGSGTTGAFNPASSAETYISDHDAAFYVNSGGVLTQTLGSSFEATKNYNLSFEFGWLGDTATYPTEPGFTVELFAGSTLLGAFTQDYVSGVPGEFKSCVLQVDGSLSGASNGSSLQIRIAGTSGKGNFDNFELVSFDRTTGVGTAALMIVDVSPVNDAPVVTSNGGGATVSVTLAENTSAVTTVTATDVDASSQVLTYSISGLDAVSFTINSSTGYLAFVTAPNFELPTDAGLDNVYDIIVLVSDGIDTGSQAIAVAVSNVNEQPVAGNDTYTAAEDQTLTVPDGSGLLANDAEPEGQATTILDYTLPGHGTVALNSDGSFSYTPDADYYGSDEFGYLSIDSTPGLVHYWRMDGTGDDLIGGADGTVNGVAPVIGERGNALQFNGTDSYVEVPDLNYANEFSVVFSFKVAENSGTGYQYIYSHGAAYNAANALNVYLIEDGAPAGTANVLRTRFSDTNDNDNLDGLDVDAAALGLLDDQWHQYVLTVKTGVGATVYVDGVQRAQIASGGDAMNPTGNLFLGARADLDPDRFYDGQLDSVMIFSRPLETSEVSTLHAGGTATGSVTINVANVNDAPTLKTNTTLSLNEGSTFTIDRLHLLVSDIDNTAAQITYTLGTAPLRGQLRVDGTAITTGGTWTQKDIDDGKILYIHDGSETTSDTFTFSVVDGAGGVIGSTATSLAIASVNNQSPVITSNGGGATATVSVAENTAAVTTLTATDADLPTQTLTYSIIGGADASKFTINSSTGVLSFVTVPNYEVPTDSGSNNVYNVTVRVSDGTLTDTQAIIVTITPLNESAPVITSNGGNVAATVFVTENSTSVTTVAASDADLPAPSMMYSISGGADAALFSINAMTGALSFASGRDYETPSDAGGNNVYDVIVQVSDGTYADTQSIAVTVTNSNDNTPLVTVGQTFLISENANNNDVIGTIFASDADGATSFSNWTIVSGNTSNVFDLNTTTGRLTVNKKNQLDAAVRPTYTLMVRVSDGINTSSIVAVTVNVTAFNDAPNASAGSNRTIGEGSSVTFDASGSSDPDGDTITYRWDIDNDGIYGELGEPTWANPTLTWANLNSFGILDNGTFTIGLQVDDGHGGTDTDTVTLRVNNVDPTITSANTISVNENVTNVLTITSIDPADAMTYSITGGSDQGRFAINSVTGALSFVAPPNFEAPTDSNTNNVYVVQVTVNDGDGGSVNQTILVTVANVNEAPSLTVSQPVVSLAENSSTLTATTIASLTISDDAIGTNSLSLAGADAENFEIAGSSLRLKAGTSLDFEAKSSYSVQVVLNDTTLIGGPFATRNIILNVTNVDEAPTADAGGPYAIFEGGSLTVTAGLSTDPEGLPMTYRWDIDNDGSFDDATGSTAILTWAQLKALSIPVNDSSVRVVRVRVTDAGGNSAVDSAVLTIADTAPTIHVTGAATAISGTPCTLNIATSDPGNDTISSFHIVWGDGSSQIVSGTTTSVQHVYSTPGITRSISVTATDENGTHVMTGGPLLLTVGNTTPSAISLDNVRVSGFTAGAVVGNVTFVDPDIGDSHTIAVSDARFQVVSGVLRLKAGISINPDIEVSVPVIVTVTDLSGASASATFVVEVNRAPVATAIPEVTAAEDFGTLTISTASTFTDPDGDTLTYTMSIVSQNAGLLTTLAIDSVTGQVTATSAANRYGSAVIDVTATDRSGASAVARLTVDVRPVNDAPVAQNYSNSTFIDKSLTVAIPGIRSSVSDVDGDTVTVTLVSGPASGTVVLLPNGSFVYTPASGFRGIDTFRFVASDGVLFSNTATATISVVQQFIGPSNSSSNNSNGFGSSAATTTSTSGTTASTTTSSNSGTTSSAASTTSSTAESTTSASSTASNSVMAPGANNSAPGTSSPPVEVNDKNDDEIFGMLPTRDTETTVRIGNVAAVASASDTSRFSGNEFTRRTYTVTQRFDFDQVFSSFNSNEEIQQLKAQRESLYRQLSARVVEQSESVAEQLENSTNFKGRVVGSVGVVTTGFSVGYLFWAIRGGMLVSGLLAQVPAWTMLDPLLVIDGDQKDEDKESLQNLMDRQQAKMNSDEDTTMQQTLMTEKIET